MVHFTHTLVQRRICHRYTSKINSLKLFDNFDTMAAHFFNSVNTDVEKVSMLFADKFHKFHDIYYQVISKNMSKNLSNKHCLTESVMLTINCNYVHYRKLKLS